MFDTSEQTRDKWRSSISAHVLVLLMIYNVLRYNV